MDALPPSMNMTCSVGLNPWDCGSSCCNWWNLNKQWESSCGALICPNANSTVFCAIILQLNLNTGIAEVTTVIEVQGNLTVPPASIFVATPHGSVNVSGCVSMEGALQIDLQHQHIAPAIQINAISSSCFIGNGTASSLSIINVDHCQKVDTSSQALEHSILIVFITSLNTCGNTEVIAGAVVGGVGALAIAFIVVVMLVPSLKKKFLPFLMTKEERKSMKSLDNTK